jgi:hypothetical protein
MANERTSTTSRSDVTAWRRLVRGLSRLYTSVLWLAALGWAAFFVATSDAPSASLWILVALLAIGAVTCIVTIVAPLVRRRVVAREHGGILLVPRFVVGAVAAGVVAIMLFAPPESELRHRWRFVELNDDPTALGLEVSDASAGVWRLEDHDAATGHRALVNDVGSVVGFPATAIARDLHTRDAIVRTRCKASVEHASQSCGIVFAYTSDRDHYVARVDAKAGTVALGVVEAGFERELATARVAIERDAWQELEVVADGHRIVVRHNGAAQLEASLPSVVGAVGLWAPGDAKAWFDELTVEPLRAS